MSRFRRFLHWLRASMLFTCGGLWWAKRQLRGSRAIIVLAFHRVLDDRETIQTNSLPGMCIRTATFERLVAHVVRTCETIDLSRAIPCQGSARLRIAFTFDDGWIDTRETAFPIAQAHQLPITVFVCPELMGSNLPFWPERVAASIKALRKTARDAEIEAAIDRLKKCSPEQREQMIAELSVTAGPPTQGCSIDSTLSWGQAAEMDRDGVTIGAHTLTHQILTLLPEHKMRSEIQESKTAIERSLEKPCRLFAYPNGDHSPVIRRLVAEAGFELAFTTRFGAWTTACDRLLIPRLNVFEGKVAGPWDHFSPAMFEYLVFWRVWRSMYASHSG